jgi:hypothetical protein
MGETVRVEIDAHSIDRLGRALARELRASADDAALDAAIETATAPAPPPADMQPCGRHNEPYPEYAYLDEAGRVRWVAVTKTADVPKGWKALYVKVPPA